MKRTRPTIDQVIAELGRLEERDRELLDRGGLRGSLNHTMRLWCDGAAHALAWAVGGSAGLDSRAFARRLEAEPRQAFRRMMDTLRTPPSAALRLLELALRPPRGRKKKLDLGITLLPSRPPLGHFAPEPGPDQETRPCDFSARATTSRRGRAPSTRRRRRSRARSKAD